MKKIIALFVLCLVLLTAFAAYTKAQSFLPFGGRAHVVKWCSCPVPGALIQVGPPVGGLYFYPFVGATLFMNYNIFMTGTWLLGLATPGGTCGNYEKGYCAAQVPAQGTIRIVGTS